MKDLNNINLFSPDLMSNLKMFSQDTHDFFIDKLEEKFDTDNYSDNEKDKFAFFEGILLQNKCLPFNMNFLMKYLELSEKKQDYVLSFNKQKLITFLELTSQQKEHKYNNELLFSFLQNLEKNKVKDINVKISLNNGLDNNFKSLLFEFENKNYFSETFLNNDYLRDSLDHSGKIFINKIKQAINNKPKQLASLHLENSDYQFIELEIKSLFFDLIKNFVFEGAIIDTEENIRSILSLGKIYKNNILYSVDDVLNKLNKQKIVVSSENTELLYKKSLTDLQNYYQNSIDILSVRL